MGGRGQKWLWPLRSWNPKICTESRQLYFCVFSAAYAIISRLKQQEFNDSMVSSDSITLDDDDLFSVKVRLHGIVDKYEVKKVLVEHALIDIFRKVVKELTKIGKLLIFGNKISSKLAKGHSMFVQPH